MTKATASHGSFAIDVKKQCDDALKYWAGLPVGEVRDTLADMVRKDNPFADVGEGVLKETREAYEAVVKRTIKELNDGLLKVQSKNTIRILAAPTGPPPPSSKSMRRSHIITHQRRMLARDPYWHDAQQRHRAAPFELPPHLRGRGLVSEEFYDPRTPYWKRKRKSAGDHERGGGDYGTQGRVDEQDGGDEQGGGVDGTQGRVDEQDGGDDGTQGRVDEQDGGDDGTEGRVDRQDGGDEQGGGVDGTDGRFDEQNGGDEDRMDVGTRSEDAGADGTYVSLPNYAPPRFPTYPPPGFPNYPPPGVPHGFPPNGFPPAHPPGYYGVPPVYPYQQPPPAPIRTRAWNDVPLENKTKPYADLSSATEFDDKHRKGPREYLNDMLGKLKVDDAGKRATLHYPLNQQQRTIAIRQVERWKEENTAAITIAALEEVHGKAENMVSVVKAQQVIPS
ncbi:hypothetical protein HK097_010187 [Rhizophlyctis rosea]|uniref:Uncharacterized protein n=1 Tax=Rhizophlyctis rosea TaxID=64517 RepID=A0AAD5S9J8_9FUNG|nr:hypothetical protein HK097_010187 [Rhizophlyctis rosea]